MIMKIVISGGVMKRGVLSKCFAESSHVSLILIFISVCVSSLILYAISILYHDFTGWKRDVLNGVLVLVVYEACSRIQKICKRFKL